MARKNLKPVYASTNSPAGRNGNYAVSLDFTNPRPTVKFTRQPERTTFTQRDPKRNYKK